jgi:hypothetical protein
VLFSSPFNGRRVFVVGDPAGIQKSQITEETPFDVLRQEGLLAYPASTNKIDTRLTAVEKLFQGVSVANLRCRSTARAARP